VIGDVNAARRVLPQWQIEAGRFGLVRRLADDLAHEFKNPLHALVINLEVMKRRVEKGNTPAALERAAVLEHEVHRLDGLLDALLKLLRPERGASGPISFGELWSGLGLLIGLRARLARVEYSEQDLPEDAYVAVAPDVVRFAVLGASEYVLDAARPNRTPITLTGSSADDEIVLTLVTPGKAHKNASPDELDSLSFAAHLLNQVGGAVETKHNSRVDAGTTVLVRIPRASYT
jgi:C4-dicarboxylate-specific signal transduction histidine kinase